MQGNLYSFDLFLNSLQAVVLITTHIWSEKTSQLIKALLVCGNFN